MTPDTGATPGDRRSADDDLGLPPLPRFSPLPALRPMTPMPRLPWESATDHTDPAAASRPPAAAVASRPRLAPDLLMTPSPAVAPRPTSVDGAPEPAGPPPVRTAPPPPPPAGHPAALQPPAGPTPDGPEPARELPVQRSVQRPGPVEPAAGRHSAPDLPGRRSATARAVLIIGGGEPLGEVVADRLAASGHHLAVHDVAVRPDGDVRRHRGEPGGARRPPVVLAGDRGHADEVARLVRRAERGMGRLDAVVVLPGRRRPGLRWDTDAESWADGWSQALAGEVLAAACAAHAAAGSFLANRRAGRIVLVTGSGDPAAAGSPAGVTEAAVAALGAELAREWGPRGIGVSVVTAGPAGATDFAATQVADVIDALLATPVLSGTAVRIG